MRSSMAMGPQLFKSCGPIAWLILFRFPSRRGREPPQDGPGRRVPQKDGAGLAPAQCDLPAAVFGHTDLRKPHRRHQIRLRGGYGGHTGGVDLLRLLQAGGGEPGGTRLGEGPPLLLGQRDLLCASVLLGLRRGSLLYVLHSAVL